HESIHGRPTFAGQDGLPVRRVLVLPSAARKRDVPERRSWDGLEEQVSEPKLHDRSDPRAGEGAEFDQFADRCPDRLALTIPPCNGHLHMISSRSYGLEAFLITDRLVGRGVPRPFDLP